ncbi:MAG: murein biosynthesis integral membrane protein MurJ [Planctomycetota bacterium]|nr:MAG: murein biosynthesis integral membrane protein MurJ [Planctomycetota bacterium]
MQDKKEFLKTTARLKAIILPEEKKPEAVEAEVVQEEEAAFSGQSVLRAALIMMVIHMVSRILGMAREILITQHFGASRETDAFFTAELICVLFPMLFGESLAVIMVTIFSEYRAKKEEDTAWKIANSVFHLSMVILAVGAGLIYFLSPYLIPLVYSFDQITVQYVIQLIGYMLPIVIFVVLMELAIGIFEAHHHFTLPSTYFVIINSFIITFIVILDGYYNLGIRSAAFGYTAGVIFTALLFWTVLFKKTGKYSFSLNWRHEGVRKVFILLVPLFLAKCSYMLLGLIDQLFASTLEKGSLSALTYGYMLFFLVPSFFILALQKAFFPTLSDHIQDGEKEEASELFHKVIDLLGFLVIPLSIYFFLFSESIVRIIFERGEFTEHATYLTSQSLAFYSVGMLFAASVELTKAVFFAFQNTRIPFITQILMILLNTALNFLLIAKYQVAGLALASSISEGVIVLLLLYLLHQKYMALDILGFAKSFLALALVSAIGVSVAYGADWKLREWYQPHGSVEELAVMAVSFTLGALIYLLLSFALRLYATQLIWEILDERILSKFSFWRNRQSAKKEDS